MEKALVKRAGTILLVLAMLAPAMHVNAQTWDEWFHQKKTQIKYLVNQIAALNVYIQDVEKGYAIVQKGTEVIGNIKKGDFNLHSDYFASLKGVSLAVKSYIRVADIIALQLKIVQNYHACYSSVQQGNWFTGGEVNVVYTVFTKLLTESTANIDLLISLTTAGNFEMTDDERLRHIDALYSSMSRMYRFSQSLLESTQRMAWQRQQEQFDAETGKILYGIK